MELQVTRFNYLKTLDRKTYRSRKVLKIMWDLGGWLICTSSLFATAGKRHERWCPPGSARLSTSRRKSLPPKGTTSRPPTPGFASHRYLIEIPTFARGSAKTGGVACLSRPAASARAGGG